MRIRPVLAMSVQYVLLFRATWLACHTLELEDQGRFLGGHLLQIVFSLFIFLAL